MQVSSKSVLKWLSYDRLHSGNGMILLSIILHYRIGFLVTAAPLRTPWLATETYVSVMNTSYTDLSLSLLTFK